MNTKSFFKQHPAVLFFAILILAAVVIAIAWSVVKPTDPKATPTVINREELDAKLNSLKLNVDIGYFNDALGQPTITREKTIPFTSVQIRRHTTPKEVIEEFLYREHFYINDHYYVQAVTDETGRVGMYSITARHLGYSPRIESPLGGVIQLGSSVYSEITRKPRKVVGLLHENPRLSSYYEIFSARSGDVRYAIFSSNPNGYLGKIGRLDEANSGLLIQRFSVDKDDFPIHEMHREFRKVTSINTYSVITDWFRGVEMRAKGANFGEALINFGPDVHLTPAS